MAILGSSTKDKLLTDIGEYGLHRWLSSTLKSEDKKVVMGVGDDCAVLDLDIPGQFLLVTTDRVPLITDPKEIGRFVVIHNVSDVIAMRGWPIAFLLGVHIPRDSAADQFEQIVIGVKESAQKYNLPIVGGDTKEDEKLTVIGTCLGLVDKSDVLLRDGASPGDVIAVTVCPGKELGIRWAYWVAKYFNVCSERHDRLYHKYLSQLEIPFEIMMNLRGQAGITSCIDMTEGLLGACEIMSAASGSQFVLSEEALLNCLGEDVMDVSVELGVPPVYMLFNPGFDWENLLTVSPQYFPELSSKIGKSLVPIGWVERGEGLRLSRKDGDFVRLKPFTDQKFMSFPWKDKARMWRDFDFFGE